MNTPLKLPPHAVPHKDNESVAYQVAMLESYSACDLMYGLFRLGYPHDVNEKHSDTTLLQRWCRRQGARHGPSYRVTADFPVPAAGEAWPQRQEDEPLGIDHAERVACLLVLAGADPFVPDASGLDALDAAILSGWRNLFKVIMRHPNAPDAQALSQRTLSHRNQELPWVPAVVAFNQYDWLPVFGSYGLDVAGQEDKWPAAAFVKGPGEFNGKLKSFSLWPTTQAQADKVLQHWQRRAKQNDLTAPDHAELIKSMGQVRLEDGSVSLEQMQFSDTVEKLLLASKKKSRLHFNFNDPAAAYPDLRHVVRSGANRGTWSYMSAYCMAALRLSEGHNLSKMLKDSSGLALQHHASLKETIRPGLTGEGLSNLVQACNFNNTTITSKYLEGGMKDAAQASKVLADSGWGKALAQNGVDITQSSVQENIARSVLQSAGALTTTNSPLALRSTLANGLGMLHEHMFLPALWSQGALPAIALDLYQKSASMGWWPAGVMPLSMWRAAVSSWQASPTPEATEQLLGVGRAWLEDVSHGWWDKYRYETHEIKTANESRRAHHNLQEEVLTWLLGLPDEQQPKDLRVPEPEALVRLSKQSPALAALWRSVVLDVSLDAVAPTRSLRF